MNKKKASIEIALLLVMVFSMLQLGTQVQLAVAQDIIQVNFDEALPPAGTGDSFKVGIYGWDDWYMLYNEATGAMTEYDTGIAGDVKYWDRGGSNLKNYPTTNLLRPETSVSHSGGQCAAVECLNPTDDTNRRIEILHVMDPRGEHVWDNAWFYFPSSSPGLAPLDGMLAFHRIVYERWYETSQGDLEFQISLSANTDGRSASLGDQVLTLALSKGWVPEQVAGADLYSNRDCYPANWNGIPIPDSWLTRIPGWTIPYDTWFKVSTYVYRPTTGDWAGNTGIIRVWVDDQLLFDVEGIRTVGINPDSLATAPEHGSNFGHFSSGYGVYTQAGTQAKTIYVDDVSISNTQAPPPPEESASVEGMVYESGDGTQVPIEGALVKVDDYWTDTTDSLGAYRIDDITLGMHDFSVTKDGYEPYYSGLTFISDGELITKDVLMFPITGNVWTLTVVSDPEISVGFTMDSTGRNTPWSGDFAEASYTITMPNLWASSGGTVYQFEAWEDSSTSLTRTINLVSDLTITANYIAIEKEAPIAQFTTSTVTPTVYESVTFDASGSSDPDGSIVNYEWNFGDGSTNEGIIVTHSYSSSRSYQVTLTVTDNDGITDSHTTTIAVQASPVVSQLITSPYFYTLFGSAIALFFVHRKSWD